MERIYLAPVKGITDRAFRNTFAACFKGVNIAVAPFITISDTVKKIKDLSPESNKELNTVPQVLTKSAEHFISLARILADNGADEVNWNLGCPFKKVIDRGEGAALLPFPDKIVQFLDEIFNTSLPDISVKLRLGFHNPDEILPVISIMNNYPIKEIIIHARTAEQMYDGDVNIDAFNDASRLLKKRIIYNGDIIHPEDVEYLRKITSGISGWMIGRGLLTNPYLAEEISSGREFSPEIKISGIRKFTDELFTAYKTELQSTAHVLDKMKGVWSYLSLSFENGHKIDKRIRKAGNIPHYSDEVNRVFDSELKFINCQSKIAGN